MLKKGWVTLTYGQLSSFCLRSGILRDFFSSLSWLLLFDFSSSFFFRFSLFFFCWEFRRLCFGGKIFRKAFRILGLDEKKGRWVEEQDFHGNFLVNVTLFFVFSTFERSLHFTQVSSQSCPWPLKLKTSQAVEGTRICTAVTSGSGANGLSVVFEVECRSYPHTVLN